jgi:hypothetical protein
VARGIAHSAVEVLVERYLAALQAGQRRADAISRRSGRGAVDCERLGAAHWLATMHATDVAKRSAWGFSYAVDSHGRALRIS